MDKLLIIDDSLPFLNDMEALFTGEYEIIKATTGKQGLKALQSDHVETVLLDLQLPDMDGLEVLKKIRNEIDPYIPIVIITDHTNYKNAVEAIKLGANDYVGKEIHVELLVEKIKQMTVRKNCEVKMKTMQKSLMDQHDKFIFKSNVMKNFYSEVTRIAGQDFTVLLEGETGVGKDLISREIHILSKRRDNVFIEANISGQLNEDLKASELFGHDKGAYTGALNHRIGVFEGADGGTVYIPEVQDLSNNIQVNLLGFLQYKSFRRIGQGGNKPNIRADVRLIFASNRNLDILVEKGILREDFYYRIKVAKLFIPPLRERSEDIEPIAKYYVNKFTPSIIGRNLEISDTAIELLINYNWPGNTHELQSVIRMAVLHCDGDILLPEHFTSLPGINKQSKTLPSKFFEETIDKINYTNKIFPEFKTVITNTRQKYFDDLLKSTDGDIVKAAKIAGISITAIRKNLSKHHKANSIQ